MSKDFKIISAGIEGLDNESLLGNVSSGPFTDYTEIKKQKPVNEKNETLAAETLFNTVISHVISFPALSLEDKKKYVWNLLKYPVKFSDGFEDPTYKGLELIRNALDGQIELNEIVKDFLLDSIPEHLKADFDKDTFEKTNKTEKHNRNDSAISQLALHTIDYLTNVSLKGDHRKFGKLFSQDLFLSDDKFMEVLQTLVKSGLISKKQTVLDICKIYFLLRDPRLLIEFIKDVSEANSISDEARLSLFNFCHDKVGISPDILKDLVIRFKDDTFRNSSLCLSFVDSLSCIGEKQKSERFISIINSFNSTPGIFALTQNEKFLDSLSREDGYALISKIEDFWNNNKGNNRPIPFELFSQAVTKVVVKSNFISTLSEQEVIDLRDVWRLSPIMKQHHGEVGLIKRAKNGSVPETVDAILEDSGIKIKK